jgi:hypothetical protein
VTRDQLIETMARAIYDAECPTGRLWTDRADGTRGAYITLATAALTALEAAGMRVVPVETQAHREWQLCPRPDLYNKGQCCGAFFVCTVLQEDSTSE